MCAHRAAEPPPLYPRPIEPITKSANSLLHGDDRVATFRCFDARRVAAEIAQRATAPLEG